MVPPPPPIGPEETILKAKDLVEHTCKDLTEGSRKMVFMVGVSGLELRKAKEYKPGHYIGNYPNTLLKRAICQTKQPQILFIDESKINQEFYKNGHYPVCTPSLPWEKMCNDYPIAICIAVKSQDKFNEISESLKSYGLTSKTSSTPINASNKVFCGFYGSPSFHEAFTISPT